MGEAEKKLKRKKVVKAKRRHTTVCTYVQNWRMLEKVKVCFNAKVAVFVMQFVLYGLKAHQQLFLFVYI